MRRQWSGFQICFGCTGLFASKLAPTKSSTPTTTVGASLLARAMARAPNMFWVYWPIREQARSHRVVCISQNCGSKLACEGNGPGSRYVLDVPASSRASSLPQSRVYKTVGASLLAKAMVRVPNMFWVYWPIREQVGMPPTRSNRCQPTQPALLPAPQPKAAACGDWRSSPPLPSTRSTAAGGRS